MLELRPATIKDLNTLKKWDEQPHVIASDPNDDWQWEIELQKNPEWRQQLIAEVNGVPIGCVQIIDPALEETHYWGDIENNLRAIDIWIGEKDYLGKGHGTHIMNLVLDNIFDDARTKAVLVDPLTSNTRAHRFYEKLGFKRMEQRQFGLDDCFVYRLESTKWTPKNRDKN